MPEEQRQGDLSERSALARAFMILDAFTFEKPEMSLGELVEATSLPRSTVHRLARRLESWGALEHLNGHYRVGMRLFELGTLNPFRTLRETALPYMEDLFAVTKATVQLAVLDNTEVVYIEKLIGHEQVGAPARVGGRFPAHATAVGKILLAFSDPMTVDRVIRQGLPAMTDRTITDPREFEEHLRSVRRARRAYDYEEIHPGVGCAAAPVFDRFGGVVAALSVMAPIGRLPPKRIAPAVLATALSLGRALSAVPGQSGAGTFREDRGG